MIIVTESKIKCENQVGLITPLSSTINPSLLVFPFFLLLACLNLNFCNYIPVYDLRQTLTGSPVSPASENPTASHKEEKMKRMMDYSQSSGIPLRANNESKGHQHTFTSLLWDPGSNQLYCSSICWPPSPLTIYPIPIHLALSFPAVTVVMGRRGRSTCGLHLSAYCHVGSLYGSQWQTMCRVMCYCSDKHRAF